jgi:hypothetical protein
MSCSGGHLGFPIGITNLNCVEDLPMVKCSNAFFSETTNMIKAKLYMNVHWMDLYKFIIVSGHSLLLERTRNETVLADIINPEWSYNSRFGDYLLLVYPNEL